jgi:hypothetical protein
MKQGRFLIAIILIAATATVVSAEEPADSNQNLKKGEGDQSLRSPLEVAVIPIFRGIVFQVRIFILEMAKMPFSAEIISWKLHFCHFHKFSQKRSPFISILW